jgi:hypothetical protein
LLLKGFPSISKDRNAHNQNLQSDFQSDKTKPKTRGGAKCPCGADIPVRVVTSQNYPLPASRNFLSS